MGDNQGLNQALLLQFAQRTLRCRVPCPLQPGQSPPVVLQSLQPTHIRGSHPEVQARLQPGNVPERCRPSQASSAPG